VINPDYLETAEIGVQAARKDMFQKGLIAIAASSRSSGEAIQVAADLCKLLGSTPFFVDLVEVDGLMAATHLLPQLLAAALLNATTSQPGWREARKVAGRAYAIGTAPAANLDAAPAMTRCAILNSSNVTRVLDDVLAALQQLRDDIAAEDEAAFEGLLKKARSGRETWWKERMAGDWLSQDIPRTGFPDTGGVLGRLFGTGWRPGEKKKK
jgi:prephenate dehydrogenase